MEPSEMDKEKKIKPDYAKLDPLITDRLEEVGQADRLTLFLMITRPLASRERKALLQAGVNVPLNDKRTIFTGTLTTKDIIKLSNRKWVKYIKLSRLVRPLLQESMI